MANNIVDIIINATDNATRQIDQVDRALNRLGENGARLGTVMARSVGSIGALAPAIAGVGALGAMFASAGAGAVGFGVVAQSAIGKVADASDQVAQIEEKIKQADSAKERIQYQKQLQQVMSGLNSTEQEALKNIQSYKDWWGQFTASFEPQVFNVMAQGLNFAKNAMTAIQPAIKTTGDILGQFMQKATDAFKTDTVQNFVNMINSSVGSNLTAILTTAGNLFMGFLNILNAFAPLQTTIANGMVNLSASFLKWTQGLAQSQGFQQFVEYAKANTPPIINTIRNLAIIIGQIVIALAPLGSVVLQVVSAFSSWLVSSGLVQAVLTAVSNAGQFLLQHLTGLKIVLASVVAGFLAFQAVMVVISIVRMATTVFNVLKTVITAVRSVFMLFNATLLANPITWVIAGIVALIAIGVLLYQNWDLVKAKALELWSYITQVWSNITSAIGSAVSSIISTLAGWWSSMVSGFINMMASIGSAVSTGVQMVIQFFLNLPRNLINIVIYMTGFMIGLFIGLMLGLANAVANGVTAIVNWFAQLPSRVMSFVTNLGSSLKSGFTNMMNSAKSAVQSGISNVVSFFSQLPSKVMSFIRSLASSLVSGFNSMMSSAKSAVSSGISGVTSFFSQLPSRVMGYIHSLASSLVSGFHSMMSSARSAVSSGVSSIVSAIHGWGSTFLSAGRGLLDAFVSGIKSGISRAIGAVRDGMNAIRQFLPFSPAKKGPLSDLDKSGESFFPTWYNGALTMVRPMEKALGGALDKANGTLQRKHGQIALEAFGAPRTTVRQIIEVRGSVDVQGEGGKETISVVGQQVYDNLATFKDLRQVIRKR